MDGCGRGVGGCFGGDLFLSLILFCVGWRGRRRWYIVTLGDVGNDSWYESSLADIRINSSVK